MSELETKQGKQAGAVRNGEFVSIQTFSGRGLLARDPEGSRYILAADVDDAGLGAALLDALGRSRFLSSDAAKQLLDRDRVKQRYEAWVREVVERYGYKSRRDLFKDMVSCNIKLVSGNVVIGPTSHPKLEAWEGLRADQSVIVPAASTAAEIGAALRLGFARCEK